MRRTALMAAVLVVAAVPQASAAEVVPKPTLTIQVTAAGQPVSKGTTTSGRWIVNRPGVEAQLTVDGTNAPGMVTVVDATWTSRTVPAYPDLSSFELLFRFGHDGAPTSSMPASVSYGLRSRINGRWTPWYDVAFPYAAGQPSQGQQFTRSLQYRNAPKKGQQVQLQFRMHTELYDVGSESQFWQFTTNV